MSLWLIGLWLWGFLAWNPTLRDVGLLRQQQVTSAPIAGDIDVDAYPCRLGLPFGHARLVGREGWFLDAETEQWHGPMLITDVESAQHAPWMQEHGLVADTDCRALVHRRGWVFVPEPALSFTGLSLEGEYLYQDGTYRTRWVVMDGALAIAQADFFPPETDPPCVWIRSTLEDFDGLGWRTIQRIDYCGGVGWQHWIVEPRQEGWMKWTVEIGRPGRARDERLIFWVKRRDAD